MNDARSFSQFKLRMPPALRSQVEQAAEASLRSLNAELVFRLQQSFEGEVPADAAEQVPAPTASVGLRLLCLLVPSRTGEIQSLPIHTMHRMPPYARLHRSYRDGEGRWSVALDPLDLPGGTGFYLRQTHARAPSAEVLARCLRQRQTHALRTYPRIVRVGGLSHDH
ncbi:Arc family DNA-binding protein [Pseudomonas sp. ATCC 13867]|nr:Arc family DNA-binding protein [Pseudomonas sp. ATCC 13867]